MSILSSLILALIFLSPSLLAAPSPPSLAWRLPSSFAATMLRTSTTPPALTSFSLPTTSRAGLTLELCTSEKDCNETRSCISLTTSEMCTPDESGECRCRPEQWQYCVSSDECLSGEVCANTALTFLFLCVSAAVEAEFDLVVEVTPLPEPSGSLTFDFCAEDSQCAGNRTCGFFAPASDAEECNGREPCFCLPASFQPCFHSPDCENGEVCAEGAAFLKIPACFSAVAEQNLNALQAVTVPEDTRGLTLDPCETDGDCQDPRRCIDFASNSSLCRGGIGSCACISWAGATSCSADKPCEEGEVCSRSGYSADPICMSKDIADAFSLVVNLDDAGDGDGADPTASQGPPSDESDPTPSNPVPPTPSPSPTPTPEPVCVDAKALGHLPASDLVYSNHAVATVLCDSSGSCSTGGHVVVWRGKAMMMRSYCAAVGCTRRVMEVNSPRYERRRRVASRTLGLEYTAFAARYGSRAEEALIAAAVRVGL